MIVGSRLSPCDEPHRPSVKRLTDSAVQGFATPAEKRRGKGESEVTRRSRRHGEPLRGQRGSAGLCSSSVPLLLLSGSPCLRGLRVTSAPFRTAAPKSWARGAAAAWGQRLLAGPKEATDLSVE